jgi:hypothetical protein
MEGIFLDDWRFLNDAKHMTYPTGIKWMVIRTFSDFGSLVLELEQLPQYVSFDYDLNSDKDGIDCLKWLVEYCREKQLPLPECFIHSQHDTGKEEMEILLKVIIMHLPPSRVPLPKERQNV